MPSDIIITIKIKEYLREYAIHKWGPEPIIADRKNNLGSLIQPLLQLPPRDYTPVGEGNLKIRLPYYKYTNVYSRNYLSPKRQAIIAQSINDDFLVDFYKYMNKAFLSSPEPGIRKHMNKALVQFCDEFEIVGSGKDTIEMLRKKYYRYRKKFRRGVKISQDEPDD